MHDNSPFSIILERLLRGLPNCLAVGFIDLEGEAVEAVGWVDLFDIKVTGAHLLIILRTMPTAQPGATKELVITATRMSYRVQALPEGYALVLMFSRDGAFDISPRAVQACSRALCREAGFDESDQGPIWFAVEVTAQNAGASRPHKVRAEGDWHEVEVLGALVGLADRERGYRVRLANGNEVTLLREPLGRWWSDSPIH
jgi:hypothetical protein